MDQGRITASAGARSKEEKPSEAHPTLNCAVFQGSTHPIVCAVPWVFPL